MSCIFREWKRASAISRSIKSSTSACLMKYAGKQPNKEIVTEGPMSGTKRLTVFEKFIQNLRAAWAELPDMEARMKKGQKLLEDLIKDPTLREASKTWP